MTISSTTRKAGPFFGNDATIDFPFTFKVFKKQDLLVTLTDTSGADTPLTLDSTYSVTLNTDQDANPGGVVRYPIVGAALPAGWRLTITGALPNTQPTDIQNSGGFYPQVVEDMSDRSTIQIQQLQEEVDRSLKFSVSDSGAGTVLPPADLRANKVLAFDQNGKPITVVPIDGSATEVAIALESYINAIASDAGTTLIGYKGTTLYDFLQDKFLLDPFFYVTSRSAAAARDIPPVVSRLFVGGYTVEGDCEPMWFEAVADSGTLQPWQFRSNGATRRWELRMRGMVTPEMFGAKRDGTTNDRDAIVNAMLFCHAIGGGKVECLPGTYFITNSIAATSINGVTLTSRVPRAATIKIPQVATPGGGLPSHIIVLTNCSNIEVSGLALLGNRQVSNTYTAFCGIYLISCQNYKIKNNAISWVESICISVNTGCVNGDVSDNYLNNASSGIWLFKGNINADINRNRIDLMQIHGILTDDATSADTTPATSSPNQYIRIDDNFITNFSLSGGLGAGVVMSGQVGGSITNNDIAVGGVNGTSAASGIVVNSGQDTYNKCDGVVISDNRIRDIYGGGGITLQGAHGCTVQGNSMWNLFLWPTSLSGAAINIVEDVAGAHSVSLQRTQYNIVGGNTVRANGNTQYAVQLGANTLANCIYKQQCLGVGVTDVQVVTGTGQGQLHFKGYGALPTYNLGWRGAQWHNTTDDKLYIATNTAWVVVGTQT